MDLKSDIKKNTMHWSFMIAWKILYIPSKKKKKRKKKRDSIGVFINLFIFTLIQKLVQNNVEKKCVTNSDAIKSVKMMLGT